MKMPDSFQRIIGKLVQLGICSLNNIFKKKGTIWMIHHVNSENPNDEFTISPQNLERCLLEYKNNTVPISRIISDSDFNVFTIDDVSEDFFINGFPLFLKHKIPFTIFVCVELIDKPGYISRKQLLEMSRCPLCTVGSHGTKHKYFKTLSSKDKKLFLEDSKIELQKLCGKNIDVFAFPYGSIYACGFMTKRIVGKYYKLGFSTLPIQINTHNITKRYFLPRINLNNSTIL